MFPFTVLLAILQIAHHSACSSLCSFQQTEADVVLHITASFIPYYIASLYRQIYSKCGRSFIAPRWPPLVAVLLTISAVKSLLREVASEEGPGAPLFLPETFVIFASSSNTMPNKGLWISVLCYNFADFLPHGSLPSKQGHMASLIFQMGVHLQGQGEYHSSMPSFS